MGVRSFIQSGYWYLQSILHYLNNYLYIYDLIHFPPAGTFFNECRKITLLLQFIDKDLFHKKLLVDGHNSKSLLCIPLLKLVLAKMTELSMICKGHLRYPWPQGVASLALTPSENNVSQHFFMSSDAYTFFAIFLPLCSLSFTRWYKCLFQCLKVNHPLRSALWTALGLGTHRNSMKREVSWSKLWVPFICRYKHIQV